jgi:uncharacterized repeat protein (TIGR02543 family)
MRRLVMKRICAGAAAVLLLAMLACEMGGTETDAGTEGKAAVRIEVEGAGARTVLPKVALTDAVSWKVFGAESPAVEQPLLGTYTSMEELNTGLHLKAGAWDFTLEGYNEAEGLILRGVLVGKEITLGQTNTLSFRVAPVKEDHGGFVIRVTLPGGSGITRADVFIAGEAVTEGVRLEGNKVIFENGSYPAGDHYFTIKLYQGDDSYSSGVVSDVVQVRKNLSSEKEYALELKDLNVAYAINYHLGYAGGVMASGSYRSTDRDYILPTPAREGYTFGAWYEEFLNEGEDPASPVSVISQGSEGDKDFYAAWTPIEYTVEYDKNAADATGTTASSGHVYDTAKQLTANGFSRTGYTFGGWGDGSGGIYTDGESVENLSAADGGEVTLYARWEAIEYKITYVQNGGPDNHGNPGTYTIESAGISLGAPAYSSNVFDGWYEDSGYSTRVYTIPAGSTGDKTFYGKWKSPVGIGVDPLPGDLSPGISPEDPRLTKGTSQEFSVIIPVDDEGNPKYTVQVCEWYLNDELVGTGLTYTLTANTSRVHSLMVKVTTDAGDTLSSAICRVTINEGGGE